MARRKFYNGPGREVGLPKGFDSWLEVRLYEGPFKKFQHHTEVIPYTWEHKYHPDFIVEKEDGRVILIEVKGRFRESSEAAKYTWVRKSLPKGWELVFMFENPDCAMPHAKARKDGTKRTHAEWADKHGFRYRGVNELSGVPTLKQVKEMYR